MGVVDAVVLAIALVLDAFSRVMKVNRESCGCEKEEAHWYRIHLAATSSCRSSSEFLLRFLLSLACVVMAVPVALNERFEKFTLR
jgi:hypothetical protein